MSRVSSYGCDCCGIIKQSEVMNGISQSEDLFDRLHSHAVIPNPDKAQIHFCLDCYNDRVLLPARSAADRRTNEDAYRSKVLEFTLILKQLCVRNWQEKKFFKRLD